MKEIVSRLHENRQIELAKSILEANGYVVTKKVNEGEASPLRKLLDIDGGINTYAEYPETFDYLGEEAVEKITKYLGCQKEDLVSLAGRDEMGEDEMYQGLCDLIYDNSTERGTIECDRSEDTLTACTTGGTKYVLHIDGDSYPEFIVSQNVR